MRETERALVLNNEAITMITGERERQGERALVLSNEAITMITRERERY